MGKYVDALTTSRPVAQVSSRWMRQQGGAATSQARIGVRISPSVAVLRVESGLFFGTGGSGGSAIRGYLWTHVGWPGCVVFIVEVYLTTITLALIFWQPLPKVAGVPMLTAAIEEG